MAPFSAHVVLQARSEADIDPSLIRKRVSESSGAKYSVHSEPAQQKLERPAPVGSSYKPIGRPDIAAMQAGGGGAPAATAAPEKTGTDWKPRHNELEEIRKKAAEDAKREREKSASASVSLTKPPENPPPVPAAARPTVRYAQSARVCLEP